MNQLEIFPIRNDLDHGNDPDAYRTVFCNKDIDLVQLTQCKECDHYQGITDTLSCDRSKKWTTASMTHG